MSYPPLKQQSTYSVYICTIPRNRNHTTGVAYEVQAKGNRTEVVLREKREPLVHNETCPPLSAVVRKHANFFILVPHLNR